MAQRPAAAAAAAAAAGSSLGDALQLFAGAMPKSEIGVILSFSTTCRCALLI
jgi:hypothetical protein